MPEEKTFDDHDKLVRMLTLMEGFQGNFVRLESEVKEVRLEVKEVRKEAAQNNALLSVRVDEIEGKLDRQQGGVSFARWLWGAIVALPFGLLVGWISNERGGP